MSDSRVPRWGLPASIALLAVAGSFNGVLNDFVYDDLYIVQSNAFIHDLRRIWTAFFLPYWPLPLGGDGYRPLTTVLLAVQWALAPNAAAFFHAVSIALYAAVCVLAFALASEVLSRRAAWVVAALFAVHPVHVEAVAGVVGQSELWTALFLFGGTIYYLRARDRGSLGRIDVLALALTYVCACLSKEHGIVFPALLVAAEVTVVRDVRAPGTRARQLLPAFAALALVGVIFVAWRALVIPGGVNGFATFAPFIALETSVPDRILTAVSVVPTWSRLLLWPARLATEYGPPRYPVAHGLGLGQLPGFLILFGVLGLALAARRKAPVCSFGILWLVLTLLPSSNFILPAGLLVAERTLFAPSFGAMLAIVAALAMLGPMRTRIRRTAILTGTAALVWLGIVRSITRTAEWRNNGVLFRAGVATHPDSYRAHYALATWLMARGDVTGGEREFIRAIGLFPDDPAVTFNLGQEYFYRGQFRRAHLMYARTEQLIPRYFDVRERKALALAAMGRYDEARVVAEATLRTGTADSVAMRGLLEAASLDARSRQVELERLARKARVHGR